LIPNSTNDSDKKCYAVMLGDANVVAPGRIWRFTIRNFVAREEMIPRRT
jgi:hypothetical protein